MLVRVHVRYKSVCVFSLVNNNFHWYMYFLTHLNTIDPLLHTLMTLCLLDNYSNRGCLDTSHIWCACTSTQTCTHYTCMYFCIHTTTFCFLLFRFVSRLPMVGGRESSRAVGSRSRQGGSPPTGWRYSHDSTIHQAPAVSLET